MSNGIRVIPPPFGVDTAWFGGKIISSVSYLHSLINIQILFAAEDVTFMSIKVLNIPIKLIDFLRCIDFFFFNNLVST